MEFKSKRQVFTPVEVASYILKDLLKLGISRHFAFSSRSSCLTPSFYACSLSCFISIGSRLPRFSGQSNTGSPAKDAVLTTPCDSTPEFERDLVAAARAAGFNVLRLVKEPVAAVMAYGLGMGAM